MSHPLPLQMANFTRFLLKFSFISFKYLLQILRSTLICDNWIYSIKHDNQFWKVNFKDTEPTHMARSDLKVLAEFGKKKAVSHQNTFVKLPWN